MTHPNGADAPILTDEGPVDPAPEAPSAAEAPEEAIAATNGRMSVKDRLRAAYREGDVDRDTTIPVAPGTYTDLAAKYRPIDYSLRRKLTRRAEKTGATGAEANLDFQATLLADACVEMLFRPESGADYVGLHTLVDLGAEPIRYDSRLAAVIGITLPQNASQATVARLVFKDPVVFDAHYNQFALWSTQVVPDDDEDEDDGADVRPT